MHIFGIYTSTTLYYLFRSERERRVVAGIHSKGRVSFCSRTDYESKYQFISCTTRTSSVFAAVTFHSSLMTQKCTSPRKDEADNKLRIIYAISVPRSFLFNGSV
jgi:hypothetical protein